MTGELSIKALIQLTYEAMASVTQHKWDGYVKHVIKLEDSYRQKDRLIEEHVDEIIINRGENSSEDECNYFVSSDEESDFDNKNAFQVSLDPTVQRRRLRGCSSSRKPTRNKQWVQHSF